MKGRQKPREQSVEMVRVPFNVFESFLFGVKRAECFRYIYWDVAKPVRHRTLTPACSGSNPDVPAIFFWWSCIQAWLRNRSATPLSLVQIRPTPPKFCSYGGIGRHVGLRNRCFQA